MEGTQLVGDREVKAHEIVKRSSQLAENILEGTQFAGNQEVQALMDEIGEGFEAVLQTEPGQLIVNKIGTLGKMIKTEKNFKDTVIMLFHSVRKLAASSTPMAKFGFFLLGLGALIATIASLPIVAENALAVWVLRILAWLAPLLCGLAGIAANAIAGGARLFKLGIEAFFNTPSITPPSEDSV